LTKSPEAADKNSKETLSVVSRGGYTLNITFYWEGKKLKALGMEPAVNRMNDLKNKLNASQLAAVSAMKGPILVIAGRAAVRRAR